MLIEHATEQDVDVLLVLYQDFIKKVYSMEPPPIEFLRPKFVEPIRNNHLYILRAPQNALASFCIIANDDDSKFGHIHALYTARGYESRGFGTYLVAFVTRDILKLKEAALLGVDQRNPHSYAIWNDSMHEN
jgi:ribosomal protein S18 acetylase RimI-like enzyme